MRRFESSSRLQSIEARFSVLFSLLYRADAACLQQARSVTDFLDPMAGLSRSKEDNPFTKDELTVDYNTNHGPDGRFCSGNNYSPDKGPGSGSADGVSKEIKALWPNNKVLTYVECNAILDNLQKGFGAPAHWNTKNLHNHFGSGSADDHSGMYPGWSINDYQYWSCSMLDHNPDGDILLGTEMGVYRLRYCTKTNDFVKENRNTGVITMFKPDKGRDYYEGQIR